MEAQFWRIIISILWFYFIRRRTIGRMIRSSIFSRKFPEICCFFCISHSGNTYLMLDITKMYDKHHRLQLFHLFIRQWKSQSPQCILSSFILYLCIEKDDHSLCSYSSTLFMKKKMHRTLIEKVQYLFAMASGDFYFFLLMPSRCSSWNHKVYVLFEQEIMTLRWLVLVLDYFDNYFFTELSVFQNAGKLNLLCAVFYLALIYYFIFSKICDMASSLLCKIFYWNESILQFYAARSYNYFSHMKCP